MNYKKAISMILLCTISTAVVNASGISTIAVQAATSSTANADGLVIEHVNPMYEGEYVQPAEELSEFSLASMDEMGVSRSAARECASIEEAAEYVRKQMVNREEEIVVTVKKKYYSAMANDIGNMAVEYNDSYKANEGDYIRCNYLGWSAKYSNTSSTSATITYTMKYLSTADQEAQVTNAVETVLNGLNVGESSDYLKVKAVHDYIVSNIKYDESLSKHSTYDAIVGKSVVCQGFGSLTYRLLRELDVPVRYIKGTAGGGKHGWNIVKLDGKWYNLDNTWDQAYTEANQEVSYKYFLKKGSAFSDHIRSAEFNTTSFRTAYPIALKSMGDPNILVTSINIGSSFVLKKGTYKQLTASVLPSDAGNTFVEWVSSDDDIATVDETGRVVALKEGKVTISAKAKDSSKVIGKCEVTVPNILVTAIKLDTTTATMDLDDTKDLVATVVPSDAGNKEITWKSSNEEVATVNQNGQVKALKEGTAAITATSKDGSEAANTCIITVIDKEKIKVQKIRLNISSTSVKVKATKDLVATVSPSNAGNKKLTWSSSDDNIAEVDENGRITGITDGIVTITASASDGSGIKDVCKVLVTDSSIIKVKEINLDETSINLDANEKKKLTATITPSNATKKELTWVSSNEDVATVSDSGEVTSVGEGTAIITATSKDSGAVQAQCTVKVVDTSKIKVKTIKLNAATATLDIDETKDLIPTISPSNAGNKELKWTSSNKDVATVSDSGEVKAVAEGEAVITATAQDGSGVKATCSIKVIDTSKISVQSIRLNISAVSIKVKETKKLTATVLPSNAGNKKLKWTSSDEDVATVSDSGEVKAVADGTAIITAEAEDGSGVEKTCKIKVVDPSIIKVKTLKLDLTTLNMNVNDTKELIASIAPLDATTKDIIWTSSNDDVATVSDSGEITAEGAGTAIITATAKGGNGVKSTCKVKVVDPSKIKVSTIKLNETAVTMDLNDTKSLIATIAPLNAGNKDLKWTSSNTSVADVDENGQISSLKEGIATITATATDGSGRKATCKVTVIDKSKIKVKSIKFSSKEYSLALNEIKELNPTISPLNAGNTNLEWTSSNKNVATVDSKGNVTAVGGGSAIITATSTDGSNVTSICKVIVSSTVVIKYPTSSGTIILK